MSCTTSLTSSFGAANVEAESPASSKPSKIPLPPPHALLELVLCNEGRGKKKKTKGTEGEGATSLAVGS